MVWFRVQVLDNPSWLGCPHWASLEISTFKSYYLSLPKVSRYSNTTTCSPQFSLQKSSHRALSGAGDCGRWSSDRWKEDAGAPLWWVKLWGHVGAARAATVYILLPWKPWRGTSRCGKIPIEAEGLRVWRGRSLSWTKSVPSAGLLTFRWLWVMVGKHVNMQSVVLKFDQHVKEEWVNCQKETKESSQPPESRTTTATVSSL